jgi:hypothetical protein
MSRLRTGRSGVHPPSYSVGKGFFPGGKGGGDAMVTSHHLVHKMNEWMFTASTPIYLHVGYKYASFFLVVRITLDTIFCLNQLSRLFPLFKATEFSKMGSYAGDLTHISSALILSCN